MPLPDCAPSRELDVSVGDNKLDTLIGGAIGEQPAFDETFSVYAHGVSLSSFQAPARRQQRARMRQEPASGVEIVVPHPHDLIISKLAAGRPKDFDFARALAPIFPISEEARQQLVQEFEAAHPDRAGKPRGNVARWRLLPQQSGATAEKTMRRAQNFAQRAQFFRSARTAALTV